MLEGYIFFYGLPFSLIIIYTRALYYINIYKGVKTKSAKRKRAKIA